MNWIHKWAIGIHDPEEKGAGVYVAKGAQAHLTRDDRGGWDRVVVFVFTVFCAVALDRPGRLVGRSTAGHCPRTRSPPAAAPARRVLNKPLNRFPAIVRRRGKRGSTAEECS